MIFYSKIFLTLLIISLRHTWREIWTKLPKVRRNGFRLFGTFGILLPKSWRELRSMLKESKLRLKKRGRRVLNAARENKLSGLGDLASFCHVPVFRTAIGRRLILRQLT